MESSTGSGTLALAPGGFGRTARRDAWWAMPLATFVVLSAFVVYATWAAFQDAHYTYGPYLSPFYSPELFGDSPHAWFGPKPAWWPAWVPFSPALLILPFPGLFRLTCYYYRGAYYKAFWADPPSCGVGEPRSGYRGERSFPLILQNVHRYFLYVALGFLVVLSYDVWEALWFPDPSTGGTSFGIVVGTRMQDTKEMPVVRLLTNRFTSWVTGRLARQRIPDSQCGYRLVSRAVLPDLKLSTARFETETEMLIQAGRAGHKIVSQPIRTIYVPGRISRIHPWRDTVRFFKLAKKYWP